MLRYFKARLLNGRLHVVERSGGFEEKKMEN